ncbi:hypothetical protein FIBSPDRAFT_471915 [Athelia psychrophila]|uniref:Uncharacterized protein n=1 Tax=Athelia psychrophila TaxID=1759441 RepID=A0A166LBF4_9AGAM|nr:hypothetical protein FIBSPDRAFT_471915 [Fibularhizoctonia sp. CBS 109695]
MLIPGASCPPHNVALQQIRIGTTHSFDRHDHLKSILNFGCYSSQVHRSDHYALHGPLCFCTQKRYMPFRARRIPSWYMPTLT